MKTFQQIINEKVSFLPEKVDFGTDQKIKNKKFTEEGSYDITYMRYDKWIFQISIATDGMVEFQVEDVNDLPKNVSDYYEYFDMRSSDIRKDAFIAVRKAFNGIMYIIMTAKKKFHLIEIQLYAGNKSVYNLYKRTWNNKEFQNFIKKENGKLSIDESNGYFNIEF
jgi:hypothetical protein